MDYTDWTTVEISTVANTLSQLDSLLDGPGEYPDGFAELLVDYMGMDIAERASLLAELNSKANFRAYADSIGNSDMADALETLAGGMTEMGETEVAAYAELVADMPSMLDDEQAATIPNAYSEWQPDTPYAAGDRRRYEGVLYKCLQAHTSQENQAPAVAASLWARIIASDDPGNPLPWEQPDSTNPYMSGDRVTHNGHTWESDVDNNVWEPGVYGWTQLD